MRKEDLEEYLKREPFQSFRIHLSTGAFFDIRHAAMAQPTRSTLTLGLPLEDDKQRFVVLALVHVVWLEILLPAA